MQNFMNFVTTFYNKRKQNKRAHTPEVPTLAKAQFSRVHEFPVFFHRLMTLENYCKTICKILYS